jgi:hypothetical protein
MRDGCTISHHESRPVDPGMKITTLLGNDVADVPDDGSPKRPVPKLIGPLSK